MAVGGLTRGIRDIVHLARARTVEHFLIEG
jgi:hypothetical protein